MTHEFTAKEGSRLDVCLASELTDFSRSKLQRFIENGHATVNDTLIYESRFPVHEGDSIRFVEPEPEPDFPHAEGNPVEIIYEDDALLVINKPVGMVTHPNTFQDKGTLVQSLLHMRPEIKDALYDKGSAISRLRPGIVHRLDKDTAGLMVIAKTREAMLALSEQFHKRTVKKKYETVLYGTLAEPSSVNAPIQRKAGSENLMVASHDPGQGRSAVTHFTPLETYAPYEKWPEEVVTRVLAEIETGRTHQIRVHAKFIGHPVMGDKLYSNGPSQKLSQKLGLTTQQLTSVYLEFDHPSSKKRLVFDLRKP